MTEKVLTVLTAPLIIVGVLFVALLALGTAISLIMLTVAYFPWSLVGWATLLALSALINR